jgi:hypothetical protein
MPRRERSLPLRVPIHGGEALDSWAEVLARRSGMPIVQLLPALGMPSSTLQARHTLIAGTPSAVLRRIERQAGLTYGRLDAAVIDLYDTLHWPVLDGSRYCPACLEETDGRWLLRWRLPWVFACRPHQVLLADRCPGCGLMPRRRVGAAAGLHPAGACPNLITRGHICATDLRATPPRARPADDPLIDTQQWIDSRLAIIEAGHNGRADAETATLLADLHAVGHWRRIQSTADDYRPLGSDAVRAFTSYLAQQRGDRRPPHRAFTDSLLVGASAAFAIALLTATRDDDILSGLRLLTLPRPGTAASMTPRRRSTSFGQYYHWKTLSPGAHARLLRALDAQLPPVDRLRHRSCTSTPRLPDSTDLMLGRARHVPQLLWPEWAVRFTPNPRCAHPDAFRAALSICLLMPGRFEKNEAKTAALLQPHRPRLAGVILRRLVAHAGDGVLTAICALANYLDEPGSAIDYQRRRAVITETLVTEQQWKRLSRRAWTHPGKGEHRSAPSLARRYLFQLLTGADLNDTRHSLAYRGPADRTRYLGSVEKMSTPLRHALHEHAARHLHRLGIDEPLTWAPPGSICTGLDLPGRDPDDIDLDRLQRLVIDEQRSLRHAARELDTTLEHVRLAVDRTDRAPGPWAFNLAQARRQRDQQRRDLLTREFFEREITHAGKSRSQLRDETGLPISVLSRYAERAGVSLVCRRPVPIDKDWLAEQYLYRWRSFADIANELGVDAQTVNDAAHRYGIPVRTPGIQSHPDMITRLDPTLPTDIRRAVEGQLHGWQRLRRFQQAMAYPSLNCASAHLNVHVTSLISQFKRLERDLGAELFHRSTPTKPKQLTQRGTDLLAALEDPQIQALLQRHGEPPGKRTTCQGHGLLFGVGKATSRNVTRSLNTPAP